MRERAVPHQKPTDTHGEVDAMRSALRDWETFARRIPHELNAPLATIEAFAGGLHEREARSLTERGRAHLAAIRDRVFCIADNGVGFDMADAGALFSPFARLHGLSEFGGSGLGLAMARQIVQRHGGRIWAEANEGAGARFFFSLQK